MQKGTKLLDFYRISNNSVSFFIMRFHDCGHEIPVFMRKTGISPRVRPPSTNFAIFNARGGGGLQRQRRQRYDPAPGHRHLAIYHFINYLLYLLVAQLSVEGYFVAVERQLLEKDLCALYLCILFTAQRRLILNQFCFDNDI